MWDRLKSDPAPFEHESKGPFSPLCAPATIIYRAPEALKTAPNFQNRLVTPHHKPQFFRFVLSLPSLCRLRKLISERMPFRRLSLRARQLRIRPHLFALKHTCSGTDILSQGFVQNNVIFNTMEITVRTAAERYGIPLSTTNRELDLFR